MYELKDCEIKGNYYEKVVMKESNLNNIILSESRNQENSQVFTSIIRKKQMNNDLLNSLRKTPTFVVEDETQANNRLLVRHPSLNNLLKLSYEIEVKHPYLQRCILKSNEIIESYEIFHQLSNLAGVL